MHSTGLRDLVKPTWLKIDVRFLAPRTGWLGLKQAFLNLSLHTWLWFCFAGIYPFLEAFRTSVKPTFQLCALPEMRRATYPTYLIKDRIHLKFFILHWCSDTAHQHKISSRPILCIWQMKVFEQIKCLQPQSDMPILLYCSFMMSPWRKFLVGFLLKIFNVSYSVLDGGPYIWQGH